MELRDGKKLLAAASDSDINSIGYKMFKALQRSEKLEWIESRLSQIAGKQVVECWMEEGAKDDRVTLSASFHDGSMVDVVTLKEAWLLDLPNLVLERILRFVDPQTPEEAFWLMGSCRTLREITNRIDLPALAHISASMDMDEPDYARLVQLVNLCGPRLKRICVSISPGPPFNTAEQVSVSLPNLEGLNVSDDLSRCPRLVEQVAAAASNLRDLYIYTKEISSTALSRIQTQPLSFLGLCTDSEITGQFHSPTLETAYIFACKRDPNFQINVSDQTILSMLRSSSHTLRSLELVGVNVVDSTDVDFPEVEDSRCCEITFFHMKASLSFFNQLCHQSLTHLHFGACRGQSEIRTQVFENARFSLHQLLFEANNATELEAVARAVFERNQELKIVCLRLEDATVSEAAFSGIRNLQALKGFAMDGFMVSNPAALLATISRQNHPNLELVYWRSAASNEDNYAILAGFGALNMPSCVFRFFSDHASGYCSHSAYRRRRFNSCSECYGSRRDVLGCCLTVCSQSYGY